MKLEKFFQKTPKQPGFMLRVNQKEAILLIRSLAAQAVAGDAHTGRAEFVTENNEYFSIAVVDQK